MPMRRVMLWGQPGDTPFEAVRSELARRNVAHLALEQERALEISCTLDVAERVEGVLELAAEAMAFDEIGAVYARPYESWRVLGRAGHAPHSDEVRHGAALDQALYAWLDVADALVINRPSAMASNGSKPYQAELIRAQGFRVPETLVTTDPDAAREFVVRHGAVIYKSVSGVRSIVSRVTEEAMARLDDVAWCPTQFQAQVPGVDYRVHAVGERIFACEIRTEADDYRYAGRRSIPVEMTVAELPNDITERCVALSRSLGLELSGVDLRRTAEGEWYCFEVNPSPGFTYYEQAAGQPIAAAVADLLTAQ
jgi:glutathione synthase/RimK-type ligase-like ATP-grasp enzyme